MSAESVLVLALALILSLLPERKVAQNRRCLKGEGPTRETVRSCQLAAAQLAHMCSCVAFRTLQPGHKMHPVRPGCVCFEFGSQIASRVLCDKLRSTDPKCIGRLRTQDECFAALPPEHLLNRDLCSQSLQSTLLFSHVPLSPLDSTPVCRRHPNLPHANRGNLSEVHASDSLCLGAWFS